MQYTRYVGITYPTFDVRLCRFPVSGPHFVLICLSLASHSPTAFCACVSSTAPRLPTPEPSRVTPRTSSVIMPHPDAHLHLSPYKQKSITLLQLTLLYLAVTATLLQLDPLRHGKCCIFALFLTHIIASYWTLK